MSQMFERGGSSWVESDLLPEFADALEPLRDRFRFAVPGRGVVPFEELEPAFHLGYVARRRFAHFPFAAIEPHLASEWSATQRRSRLEWDDVRQAVLQAWLHRDEIERRARRTVLSNSYSADA